MSVVPADSALGWSSDAWSDFEYRMAAPQNRTNRVTRRTRFRGNGSRTQTRTKRRRRNNPRAVTTQKDVALRYVRTRMPARQRRKWVGFVRRVNAVAQSTQPLQVYQALLKGSVSTTLGTQYTNGVLLKDVAYTNQSDIVNLFKDAYGGTGTVSEYDGRRIFLKAAVLDLQIKNTGTEQCILDVYRVVCRKASNNSYANLLAQWTDCFGDSLAVGAVTDTNPALTPFDVPSFCKYWKILEKKEFIITADQLVTMQIRDPRNRVIQGRYMQNTSGGMPGLTEGYLFQVRGCPEDSIAASGLSIAAIAWSAQTTYHFAYPPGGQVETIGQSK